MRLQTVTIEILIVIEELFTLRAVTVIIYVMLDDFVSMTEFLVACWRRDSLQ